MMYCGYKDQVLLKMCSYGLYLTVDLEIIPWEEKTATILFEERNNPRNFPRKPPKTQNADGKKVDADENEGVNPSKGANKRKRTEGETDLSDPKLPPSSKSKLRIDTYGKWGCYCCYKILPAHYFESALLEDKEGRNSKSNQLQEANAVESDKKQETSAPESDKKVDMRVEYVQILGTVPGRRLPDWLSKNQTNTHATDADARLRERMEKGVDCDDLRAYYKDVTRDSHLVAPIRGIKPFFTFSSLPIPLVPRGALEQIHDAAPGVVPRTIHPPLPAIQIGEEELEQVEDDSENFRPLLKLQAGNASQADIASASYTYQIRIPRREVVPPLAPKTEAFSRICLPPKSAFSQEPVLEAGDVVPLRRICIPCGTKFAVYRRDCNRKIISKTDEQWWVCDCPEVRLAGRSMGCSSCGRKVIF